MNTLTIFLGFVILLTIIFIVYLFSDLFKNDEAKARLKEKKDWRDSEFLMKNFGYREDE